MTSKTTNAGSLSCASSIAIWMTWIARLAKDPLVDELELKRLKKRKLMLKDMISHLESKLIPDFNA